MKQRKHIVLTIMRYIYFDNSVKHIVLEKQKPKDQVKILNNIFLKKVIPTVMQSLISHIKYLHKYDSTPVLNELPKSTNMKRGIINDYIKL